MVLTWLGGVNVYKFPSGHAEVKLLIFVCKDLVRTDIRNLYFLKSILSCFEVAETVNERIDLKLVNIFTLV